MKFYTKLYAIKVTNDDVETDPTKIQVVCKFEPHITYLDWMTLGYHTDKQYEYPIEIMFFNEDDIDIVIYMLEKDVNRKSKTHKFYSSFKFEKIELMMNLDKIFNNG